MRRDRDPPHREPPSIAGRPPPHNLDAEACVLSAMMLDPNALDRALEMLQPEHFYSESNQLIFDACRTIESTGAPVDPMTIAAWLSQRELLQRCGGKAYLGQLIDETPAVANVAAHAAIVRDKWRLRRCIAIAQRFTARGYGDLADIQEHLDTFEQDLHEVARSKKDGALRPLRDVTTETFAQMRDAAARGHTITGIPTGLVDLDNKLGGLHGGDLVIIAARPAHGKSSLAMHIAVHVARQRDAFPACGVALFSLEMPAAQLAQRAACCEARADLGKLRHGYASPDDWARLAAAAVDMRELPIWIDDTPAIGLLELRARARSLQARLQNTGKAEGIAAAGLGLVIVDYLQLMQHATAESREREVSAISRGLKETAMMLGVPVVALSQLNRQCEQRGKDKRPLMSDLRDSGAVEQDADVIVFVFREEVYDRASRARGIAELIVAKQRNGPTGTVRVGFVEACTRFESLAPGEYDGEDDGDGDRYGGRYG